MQKLSMLELERLSPDDFKKEPKTSIVLILDNIRSALNVGSAFRTSDAFLIEKIALCGITAQPPHREITKTAIGASKTVEWQYYKDTLMAIHEYKKAGYQLIAVEQAKGSTPLQHFDANKGDKLALIFGNEVKGVQETAMNAVDACIEIPQFGSKHSFNVSVSMAMVLWTLCQAVRPELFE